jgi:hypothetical protein
VHRKIKATMVGVLASINVCAAPPLLLDALKYEETLNAHRSVSYNANGTWDLGDYQLNSAYIPDFSVRYNNGLLFDPMNAKEARKIASAHLDALQRNIIGNMNDCRRLFLTSYLKETVIAWNCGLRRYKKGAPQSSKLFAARVIKRYYDLLNHQ